MWRSRDFDTKDSNGSSPPGPSREFKRNTLSGSGSSSAAECVNRRARYESARLGSPRTARLPKGHVGRESERQLARYVHLCREGRRSRGLRGLPFEVTMKMHNPPHPGEVLRALCLEPLNLSVTDAAQSLGVSRKALSSILNGRAGISPEMAIRLSIAFDTSAESWLNQQVQYDLWHAEKSRKRLHVTKLSAA